MKLEEIRKLIDAATPGPWELSGWLNDGTWVVDSPAHPIAKIYEAYPADTRFIAASRTLMPKLLEAIEVLEIIARQDPVDDPAKPTRLGCVCVMAKTALRKLEGAK